MESVTVIPISRTNSEATMHRVVMVIVRKLIVALTFSTVLFMEYRGYSHEYEQDRAELYFLDWSTSTRFAFSPTDLKRTWDFRYAESNSDRLTELMNMLHDDGFPDQMGDTIPNGRFLVEYYVIDEKKVTYFADQFRLCRIEIGACRSIDSTFKQTVTQMFEKYGKKSQRRLRIEEGMKER